MASDRIRVSRALYASALIGAIEWEESFLAAHNPSSPGGRAFVLQARRPL